MSRRALIASAALASAAIADETDIQRLSRKIRIGMIGFDGHPAEILGQLKRLPDVELAAYAVDGSDPEALQSNLRNPAVQKAGLPICCNARIRPSIRISRVQPRSRVQSRSE